LKKFKNLQKDFERLNEDTIYLRKIFKSVASKSKIRFELADSTPNGKKCNGYTLKKTILN